MGVLNDTRRAAYRKLMQEHLSISTNKAYVHNELTPGRIKADARDVDKLADLLNEVNGNPWKTNAESTSLSTGIVVTTEVRNDLLPNNLRKISRSRSDILRTQTSIYDGMALL